MMKYIYLLVITILLGSSSMAHVKLNNPTGGEFFSPGDTVNIQWQELATHVTENFDLFFSPDGGVTWDVILLNIDPAQRDYNWVVPEVPTDKGTVRVVQDNEGTDYSAECDQFFTITGTSGIFNNPQPPSFKAFPNPANDLLSVEIGEANPGRSEQLRVMNHLGQLVHETLINSSPGANSIITINTSAYPGGLYYILVGNEDATEVRKVIISR